jgi:hypothetical protein
MKKTIRANFNAGVYKAFDHLSQECQENPALEKERKERGATVLDLFGGIGSGLVAAKQLGIAVDKYIYVDYDRVAWFAFAKNHDSAWQDNPTDDGIQFVYVPSFEDIDLDALMGEHGPIDLVFASPPCVDYTPMNANAQGVDGRSGRLTPLTVILIRGVEQHAVQRGHPLFFLVENVIGARDAMQLGVEPLLLDGLHYSPTNRKRYFWTNIRPSIEDLSREEKRVNVNSCLDGSFRTLLSLFHGEDSDHVRDIAPTFLASLSRQESDALEVYRVTNSGQIECRSLAGKERGRLMGFPEKYLHNPLDGLYELLTKAYSFKSKRELEETKKLQEYFTLCDNLLKIDIPPERIKQSGIQSSEDDFSALLKLQRLESEERLDQEEYEKRLYGNAWCVPVIVKLLSPLKDFFATRKYADYPYRFKWQS